MSPEQTEVRTTREPAPDRPPLGSPGRPRHCFIVTYGRSGSTLLMAILNGIPGYLIRGENGGILEDFRRAVGVLEHVQSIPDRPSARPSDAWYGISDVDRASLVRSLGTVFDREFIRPPADARCIGFKEILYGPRFTPDLEGMLALMAEMFEGSRFIFNSRRLEDVARSAWWASDPRALDYLQQCEARMREVFDRHAHPYHWVDYDEYVADPTVLEAMFEFLGEPWDEQHVRDVLAVPHNS